MSQPFSHNTHTLEKDAMPTYRNRQADGLNEHPVAFNQGPTQNFASTTEDDFDLSPQHNRSTGIGGGASAAGAAPIHQSTHIRHNNNTSDNTPTNTFGGHGGASNTQQRHGFNDAGVMQASHDLDRDTVGGRTGTDMGAGYDNVPGTRERLNDTSRPNTHGDWQTGVEHRDAVGTVGGGQQANKGSKPGLADKIVGKTQELAGKAVHDPDMHRRGELRQQGQKF
ncbi:hypothetical protein CPC08DRAFT_717396 [Agrocybe pediades]|nr:hypothetical protein CPC08DRAFT_717396 [Agrocybe pediades]